MSTVLVSGACGLIGDAVCEGLLKKGYRVIGVDSKQSEKNKDKENFVFFEAAPNNKDVYAEAFDSEEIHIFIHLACSVDNDFTNIIDDKCIGLSRSCDRFIFKMAVDAKVSHILVLSSYQVYEIKKTREPIREDGDIKAVTNYAKLKLETEKAFAFHLKKVHGVYCCIMRIPPIYTKSFADNLRSKIIDPKDNLAFLYRTGDYGFHFCCLYNIVDFVSAYINNANEPFYNGVFNVADNQPITAENIVAFLREYHKLGPVVQRNHSTDSIRSIFGGKKEEKTDYRFLDVSNLLNNNRLDTNKAKRICTFRWTIDNTT